jgi:hypothetical protein
MDWQRHLLGNHGNSSCIIGREEKKIRINYAGSEKPLLTLIKEKEPLWYLVPYNPPPIK